MASRTRDTIVWFGFLLLLILAPLPSSSISPLAQASLSGALLALLVVSYTAPPRVASSWPPAIERRYRLLMGCWLLAVTVAVAQALPLPPALIAALSPALFDLYAWALPMSNQTGDWRSFSTTPAATIQNGLLIGAYAAAFALVVRHGRSRRRITTLAITIILIGMGQAIYGVSQVGGKALSPAVGTFVNRNHFAALLAMALALAMGFLLWRWQKATPVAAGGASESGRRLDRWTRTSPLFVVSLTLLAAIIFSFSRTGLIVSFCLVVMFGIFGSLGSFRRFLGFLSLAIGAVAVLFITGAWRAFRIVAYRFEAIDESYRLAAWHGTLDLFHASPWMGIGLGGLVDHLPRMLPTFIKEVFDHTHNEPLEILAEGGIIYASVVAIGLLLYMSTVISAWVRRRDPLVKGLGWGCLAAAFAIFVFSLVEFPLRMPANALILSAILSVGWVIVHHQSQGANPGNRPAPTSRPSLVIRSLAIVGMVVAGVTITAGIFGRVGDGYAKRADAATGETRQQLLTKASDFYRRAEAIEPWQPAHAFKLGQVFETTATALPPLSEDTRTAWTHAAACYERSLHLHPANARVQAAAAWAALHSGALDQGRRAAHAALKLNPGDPNVRFAVSKWYLVQWETLTPKDQQTATALIREGARDLPLEYVQALWRFVPDFKIINMLLPDDLKTRRILLGELTERQLFIDRWAEQHAYPALNILSPDHGFVVLSYGRLHGPGPLPTEAVAAGAWSGMVEGWLSAGLTATSRVTLPPGEVVLFIPVRGEAAGGIPPILHITVDGYAIPPFSLSENSGRAAYIHVYSKGGEFSVQAMLANGAVVRENGAFAERRAKLGSIRMLKPPRYS